MRLYSIILLCFFFLSLALYSSPRPDKLPQDVRYSEFMLEGKLYKRWIFERRNETDNVRVAWDIDGDLKYAVLNVGPYEYRTKSFPNIEDSTKFAFGGQECYYKTPYDEAYSVQYGLHIDYYGYGQSIKRKYCKMLKMASIDRLVHISTPEHPYGKETDLCGVEFIYDRNGKIVKRIQHAKCDNECGFFMPFLTPGEYKLRTKSIIRKKPDKNSRYLKMLNAGDKVKVVRDTHLMQTLYGTTAPWLEIEMENGSKGYIFGGLIDIVNLWVDTEGMDFTELLNIKFLDKQPRFCFEDK